MFTLKHITPLGNEAILSAAQVTYSPAQEFSSQQGARAGYQLTTGTVFYSPSEVASIDREGFLELRDGKVFVMNDTGATVAKYDLGGWPIDARTNLG